MTPEENQSISKLLGDARRQWLSFAAQIAEGMGADHVADRIREVMEKPEQTLELSTEDTMGS